MSKRPPEDMWEVAAMGASAKAAAWAWEGWLVRGDTDMGDIVRLLGADMLKAPGPSCTRMSSQIMRHKAQNGGSSLGACSRWDWAQWVPATACTCLDTAGIDTQQAGSDLD